jgi:hypothetical protein
MKIVSQLDAAGYFVGATDADPSPLEQGVWIIPGGAVDATPPAIPQGQRARWNGAWSLEPLPVAPPPPTAPESTFVPIPDPEPPVIPPPPQPLPPPEPLPPGPPMRVTRRQARQALLLDGKLHLVQPAIDAIPDATLRALMQIEWDDSQDFERYRPSLIAIGGAIGLDDADMDALFVQAAAL